MDKPDAAIAMTLLDIAPTREMYANTTDAFARAYWHWFFLIQPAPFPEEMILKDPEAFWKRKCSIQTKGETPFTPEAQAEYLKYFQGEAVHAMCEDYRASKGNDIEHDKADAHVKINVPTLVIWGKQSNTGGFDYPTIWKNEVKDVSFLELDAGHFIVEEKPQEVLEATLSYFSK